MDSRRAILMAVGLCMLASRAFAFDSLFKVRMDYWVGSNPGSVCAADFEGDGHTDLAVANISSNNVSILKNNGAGTFAAAMNYGVGTGPISVCAADLDGDGSSDLAVANYYSNNVSILSNNGDGTFSVAVNYEVGNNPRSIYAADFDGDGKSDLAVVNVRSNTVSILKNNGNGTFAAAVNYSVGNGPFSVYAADFDGDGKFDVAVVNQISNTVSILKNNGDGSFAVAVNYGVGSGPVSVYAADFDGDGKPDLVVVNNGSNTVSVLNNNGDGSFGAAVNYGVGSVPISVYASDLDGDGKSDLAVADYGSNNVSILKNNGNGTFAAAVDYGVGNSPYSVHAADFDGDGNPDLAVANYGSNNLSILKNNSDGTFATAVNYGVGTNPGSVCVDDLDGDGDSDLIVANYGSNNLSILRNNGNGIFAAVENCGVGSHPSSVCAVDLDGDGDSDLAVGNSGSSIVSILKNNGNGTFAAAANYGVGSYPSSVCAVDLDGDNDSDLAVANEGSNNLSILRNNGNGIFAAAVNYNVGPNPHFVCAADLDGDGYSDLIVANGGSNYISVLKNNGNGTFVAAMSYDVGNNPYSVCAADLDGDGDSDLVAANSSSNNVSILRNDGNGSFAAAVNYDVGNHPSSVCAADLDGDGDSDLAAVNNESYNVSILKNNGNGTFAVAVNYGMGQYPWSVCSADLDGDGDSDLAMANYESNNISILINESQGQELTEHALSFDGNDIVTIPNRPSLNPSQITVECWIKFNRLSYAPDAQFPLCKGSDRMPGAYRLMQAGTSSSSFHICFAIGEFWNQFAVCGDFPASLKNCWSHLAGTYDGDMIKLYLNGNLINYNQIGAVAVGNSSPLYLSYDDVSGFPYYLDGSMDEVRIWNYARGEDEIRNSMNARLAGNEAGIVGYWRLDEGQGQIVGDATINTNNGYLGSSQNAESIDPTWVVFEYPSLPLPPTDLVAQAVSASGINLAWQYESLGEGYLELWRKTGILGTWGTAVMLPSNAESWANTGLVTGNTYYYRVRACNRAGCSAWSNTVAATAGSIPMAPSNLVASAISVAQIDLAWQDNSTNEQGFKIERKLGETGQWSEIARPGAGSNSYQDHEFYASGTYYYRIRAYNEAGNSYYSPEDNATNQDDPSVFDGTIEVRLGMVPVAGATVLVDRGNGIGFVKVDTTDSIGRCSIVGLSVGDRLQARKKLREQPSNKPYHSEVGNIAWELWANSDRIQDDGSYMSVMVSEQKISGDPYVLTMVHPIFKFNLVVSVLWDIEDAAGTGYWEDLEICFNKASNYLYDITDGQAMFNKIVIYDCSVGKYGADIWINGGSQKFGTRFPYWCGRFGWEAPRKIDLYEQVPDGQGVNYEPPDYHYYRGVVHEFGHWAFLLADEYLDGYGNESFFFLNRLLGLLPRNFGLMDQAWNAPTEMSSQNCYPGTWFGNLSSTTLQYFLTNNSCWDHFAYLYNRFLDPGIRITKPLLGDFDNQAKPPRRDGPVIAIGVADEIVPMNTGDGSFETRLGVVVGDSPAVGAHVFGQGRRGTRYLGQTDVNGSLEAAGLNDDDVIFAYVDGRSHSQGAERGSSAMQIDRTLQLMTTEVSQLADADAIAPGAVVDVEPVQPALSPSILIRVWPDEPLTNAPSVTAYVGGSITPVAMTANGSCYNGSVAINTADTLYTGDGFFNIFLSDTAGNESTFFSTFELWNVEAGSELFLDRGNKSCFLGSDNITQSSLVLVNLSNASLMPTGSGLTSMGDQFTVHVSPEDEYPSGATINISYDDTLLAGLDETSITIMRWDPTGLSWVSVSGSLGAPPINVVSASVPTGGVYRAFATALSSDVITPSAVNDFGAVGTQSSGELIIDWTAPGDDGMIGTALDYIVAQSESLITEENWPTKDKSVLPKQPSAAGSYEMATILLPEGGRPYYLALRTRDEAGNMSPLSNIAQGVTNIWDPNLVTGPPRNFRAIDRPSDDGNGVLLTWEPSFDDGGGKGTVEEYRILRAVLPYSVFQPVDSVPAGTTSYVDSTVVAGIAYRYWIASVDSARESYSEQNDALCAINVAVPTGDFTSDAVVGVDDFSYLVDSYAIDSTDAEFDPLYDMNEDGRIYAADFDSLKAHFGEGGVAQPDSGAANVGAKVEYRWVHITGSVWHLNVSCSSVSGLAGYSFTVNFDGSSMVLVSVSPDTAGAGSNFLNARGGLTPLFLVREDVSSVTVANVIMNPSNYTSASEGGFIANLIFNCNSSASPSLENIVFMDSEKRLSVIDHATLVSTNPPTPRAFVLYQNYPNPFNPSTTIRFDLPAASNTVLRIFDVTGRLVATLADGRMDAGQHTVVWNGKNNRGRIVASGVYFCRLQAGKLVATRKIVVLR